MFQMCGIAGFASLEPSPNEDSASKPLSLHHTEILSQGFPSLPLPGLQKGNGMDYNLLQGGCWCGQQLRVNVATALVCIFTVDATKCCHQPPTPALAPVTRKVQVTQGASILAPSLSQGPGAMFHPRLLVSLLLICHSFHPQSCGKSVCVIVCKVYDSYETAASKRVWHQRPETRRGPFCSVHSSTESNSSKSDKYSQPHLHEQYIHSQATEFFPLGSHFQQMYYEFKEISGFTRTVQVITSAYSIRT